MWRNVEHLAVFCIVKIDMDAHYVFHMTIIIVVRIHFVWF